MNHVSERRGIEGLGKKIHAFPQRKVLARDIGTITAGENDAQSRILRVNAVGEFAPAESTWHDEVREKQLNFTAMCLPKLEPCKTGGRFEDLVTQTCQDVPPEFPERDFIFDQQKGPLASRQGVEGRLGRARMDIRASSHLDQPWQVDLERRSFAQLALDGDPSPVLLHDAVGRRKA